MKEREAHIVMPKGIHRKLKSKAALEGISVKDFVLQRFPELVKEEDGKTQRKNIRF